VEHLGSIFFELLQTFGIHIFADFQAALQLSFDLNFVYSLRYFSYQAMKKKMILSNELAVHY